MPLPSVACGECGAPMRLEPRRDRAGSIWRCTAPGCFGAHGARADGMPLGVPGSAATCRARTAAHKAFDRLWREGLLPSRDAAYRWLRGVTGLGPNEAHFARFDEARCRYVTGMAEAFAAAWLPTASPVVTLDPGGLAPPHTDPDAHPIDYEGVERALVAYARARAILAPVPAAFEHPVDDGGAPELAEHEAVPVALEEEPVDLTLGDVAPTASAPSGSSTSAGEVFVEPPDGW